MARIIAVTGSRASHAHTMLAAEALKRTAQLGGHELKLELRLQDGSWGRLSDEEITQADVVIVSSDELHDRHRFRNMKMIEAPIRSAILETGSVIASAVALVAGIQPGGVKGMAQECDNRSRKPRIVAVTGCPTGIAHTFMAAEALRKSAEKLDCELRVETHGSVGSKDLLTAEEISRADAVIIAADININTAPFAGKRMLRVSTKDALRDGTQLIRNALKLPEPEPEGKSLEPAALAVTRTWASSSAYRHLMTGVSHMLPLVTAGGLLIALAFAVGGVHVGDHPGTLGWQLMRIGAGTAFHLYVPVLAAFIAYSIAERPGLASGLVGGMLATTLGAGFLGGIVAGFVAGYVTKLLNEFLKLPSNLSGLKPVLILPLVSTLIVGLGMIFLVGAPAKALLDGLTAWLNGMQQSGAGLLGLLLGTMMALDLGGPINKAAYTFSVALLASGVSGPMAATMAAGMTPPLGIALATLLVPNRFTEEERDAGRATAVLGFSFITEGAIPYAAKDPIRVIPCLVVGSAVAGALSMVFGARLMVPHGGIFALLIPHAVTHLAVYAIAISTGTLVTAGALGLAKRPQRVTA